MSLRILAVDDDPQATQALRRLLESHGYVVEVENDGTRALETARVFKPDVVLLDYRMPVAHGGDVAWQLASDPTLQHVKLIICTAANRAEFALSLPPRSIPILEKPVNVDALLAALHD